MLPLSIHNKPGAGRLFILERGCCPLKTILILGAGEYQLPLIEAAKSENYRTVICDYNAKAVGVPKADVFYEVSTVDFNAVIEVAKRERIDGIVGNSEAVMLVVAGVSETLRIPGNSQASISKLMSKKEFRDLQKSCQVYAPKHMELETAEAAMDVLDAFSYPIIIKPSESSGTRGTTKIDSSEDKERIRSVFEKCKSFSRNGLVVLEEYVAMNSNIVIEGEVFVNRGKYIFNGLFSTVRSKSATMIPMTYCFPDFLSKKKRLEVENELTKLLNGAGIQHGEYNVELYYTSKNELFTIEINARQGGNMLPVYVEKHCGINLYKLLVTTAVNDQSYWEEIQNRSERTNRIICHHVLFPRKTGLFKGIQISQQISKFVVEQNITKKCGEKILKTEDSTAKIGYIDFEWKNSEQAKMYGSHLEDYVVVVVSE